MVGPGKLFVRYLGDDEKTVLRLVEGFEIFRMIGWGDAMWKKCSEAYSEDEGYPELLLNMTGNAYSLFHFGPWALASLATFGRFWDPNGGCVSVEDAAFVDVPGSEGSESPS